MDFCRNNAVSSSAPPADYFQTAAAASPPSSSSQLDDLFPAHTAEVDMSLEWLSVFVEDCLTSTGNCLPPPPSNDNNVPAPTNPSLVAVEEKQKKKQRPLLEEEEEEKENPRSAGLQQKLFVVPGRARSKRKRVTSYNTTGGSRRRRTHHNQNYDATTAALTSPWSQQPFLHYSVDPPMLQQEYWLADSELIFPQNEGHNSSKGEAKTGNHNQLIPPPSSASSEAEEDKKKKVVVWKKEGMEEEKSHDENGQEEEEQQQQVRRCSHCLSQRTPQWRAGPLGPKTLCNACGVRYKSGRLLPEYRPAKSPTFVSFLHSNSHKKVLEMRSSGGPASSSIP